MKQKNKLKELKAKMHQRSVDNLNGIRIKLNERAMELKEEYQIEVEEAVKKEINYVRNQMELQERKHQFEMEKKEIDMATMEAALSRALARTKEVGKILIFNTDV